MQFGGGLSLAQQVIQSALFRDEEVVGDTIGKDPIMFFGHGAIEAPKAAFEVADAHAHLVGGDGCRECTVHIAHHHHQIGFLAGENGFQIAHDGGHLRVRTASTDIQEDVRHQAELLEEHIGHVRAEVLACVYDAHIKSAPFSGDLLEASDLDEIRSCADHDKDLPHPSVFLWLRVAMMNSRLSVSLTLRAGAPAMVMLPSGNELFTTLLAPMAVLGPMLMSPKSFAPGPM